MAIKKTWWGNHNGQDVFLFTIFNGHLELSVCNFGATVISIMVPGGNGKPDNMVLGYDSLQQYIDDPFYMGCVVGRFANRISNAAFKIRQQNYQLAANENGAGNHLHGGTIGFNKKVFAVSPEPLQANDNQIQFHYFSQDGEEGYPGNLKVTITYRLTNENEVIIGYEATTDQTTPVNLTSHCYFNLSGSKTLATEHELFINANSVLVSDKNFIPTGEIKPVKGSQLDFTTSRLINNQMDFEGYNDCFYLDRTDSNMDIKAILEDPASGRKMMVRTTLPGLMLYTGDPSCSAV